MRYIILSLSTQTPKNPDQCLELACAIRNAEMINNALSTAQVVRGQFNAPSVMRFYVPSNILSRCISITKTTEIICIYFGKKKKKKNLPNCIAGSQGEAPGVPFVKATKPQFICTRLPVSRRVQITLLELSDLSGSRHTRTRRAESNSGLTCNLHLERSLHCTDVYLYNW